MSFWQDLKKWYNYIFHENEILSWIANIILAFIIVKFIFYPGMGFILNTDLPLVAVISPSMEHKHMNFDEWWQKNSEWYIERGITREEFEDFRMHNGFYIGDVIMLKGKEKIEAGDIVVYSNEYSQSVSNYPIIHRATFINEDDNSFEVKGDNNKAPDGEVVKNEDVVGVAVLKIPYIGWVKILFAKLIGG